MYTENSVPRIQQVIAECTPLLKQLACGRYAISIGGSHGKGTYDEQSDVDFRLFCDDIVGAPAYWQTEGWHAFAQAVESWQAQGIEIDYCWVRTISEIDGELSAWLDGQLNPVEKEWTIWGYHLLTDIANQMVVEDPDGVITAWQRQLTPYPDKLKQAIIAKHLGSLRYWRADYHYLNKIARQDVVFLAGLSARLVHDMLQVLFALNERYYVGDGNNLTYVNDFTVKPADFSARVTTALYPIASDEMFAEQHDMLSALIDDIEQLHLGTTAHAETPMFIS